MARPPQASPSPPPAHPTPPSTAAEPPGTYPAAREPDGRAIDRASCVAALTRREGGK